MGSVYAVPPDGDTLDDICDPGWFSINGTTCEPCPIGYYCSKDTKHPCEENTIAPSMTMTACVPCSRDTLPYSNSVHTQCVECGGISEYVQDGVCFECPDGGFANSDHTGCYNCAAGTYLNNGECVECRAGYYCDGTGMQICSKGTYSGAGAEGCVECNPGYTTNGDGAINIDGCNICVPGYYKSQSDTCSWCEAGYYCSGGNSKKIACPKGTYSDYGAEECTECEYGYTTEGKGTGSSDGCNICIPGYYKTDGLCEQCQGGYSCPGGDSAPLGCPKGSYASYGSASCTKCPTGYTTNRDNSSSSEDCVPEVIKLKFGESSERVSITLPSFLKFGKINTRVIKKN